MKNKYAVSLTSTPGMYEQYDKRIVVHADDEESATELAFKLIKDDFRDRSRSMWRVENIEKLY